MIVQREGLKLSLMSLHITGQGLCVSCFLKSVNRVDAGDHLGIDDRGCFSWILG